MKLDTLIDELPKYIQHLNDIEMSKNTVKKYTQAVKNFIQYAGATNQHAQISKECFVAYKGYLTGKYKPTTANLYIVALNKYLCHLRAGDLRIKTLKIQVHHSLENCLTNDEYQRMLKVAKERNNNTVYYVMRALANTGVRVSVLKYFTVDTIKKGGCTVTNKGKIRHIIIPDKICQELISFCESRNITAGYVFFARNPEKVVSEVTVLRWLKSVAKLAGVDEAKAFPHNLRHLFAKSYIDQYNDLAELSDLLGHSKIETTRIYTRTSMSEKREKLNGLNL